MFRAKTTVVAVLAVLGLSACGGGGSGGGTTAPTARTAKATGVITGFGSVYVNGVEYETSGASYTLDGDAGSGDQDLAVGMVVTVTGTVNADGTTGTATAIDFNDEVEGVVTANNLAAGGALEVMGQSVTVTATTRFESRVAGQAAPADIVAGNVIEVSGHSDGNGNVVATRIEVKAADIDSYAEGRLEVKGTVANVDANLKTFTVGSLTVDYSGATHEEMPALESDWNGVYIEVKTNQGLVGGVMLATKVEPEGDGELDFDGEDGDEIKAQGVITAVTSATEFTLNGRPVRIGSGDDGEDAVTVSVADVGRYAKVEGSLDASGTLVAEEVEFEHEGEISLKGSIEGEPVDGTLVLHGQTIRVTSTTLLNDDRDEGAEFYFDLSDIHSGDRVEVDAYFDGTAGELVAVSLKRDDDQGEADEIDGTVESVGVGTFVVAGVTVNWAGVLPAVDAQVEVEGSYDVGSGVFAATTVQLDD